MNGKPTSYIDGRLEPRLIPDRGGRGVFARERIAAGDVVAAWGGEVIDGTTMRSEYPGTNSVTVQIDEDLFLISSSEGPGDWINHSCEPNVGLRGQIVLVALRDIEPGDEVCYDYAMSDGSDYDELDCRCGASLCRGRITGDDWRLPGLIERYGGFFSPYLQRRITAMLLIEAEPVRERSRRRTRERGRNLGRSGGRARGRELAAHARDVSAGDDA